MIPITAPGTYLPRYDRVRTQFFEKCGVLPGQIIIVRHNMRLLLSLLLLGVLSGCRRSPEQRADIYRDAKEAEVIVLADVKREGNRERYFARTVLKGKLGSEFRFKLGSEITPGVDGLLSNGEEADQIDSILLFYRPSVGALSHFGMHSIRKNKILSLKGADGELSEFMIRLKRESIPEAPLAP
jgi:hypothetical protein